MESLILTNEQIFEVFSKENIIKIQYEHFLENGLIISDQDAQLKILDLIKNQRR